jgi:hypothetical protein
MWHATRAIAISGSQHVECPRSIDRPNDIEGIHWELFSPGSVIRQDIRRHRFVFLLRVTVTQHLSSRLYVFCLTCTTEHAPSPSAEQYHPFETLLVEVCLQTNSMLATGSIAHIRVRLASILFASLHYPTGHGTMALQRRAVIFVVFQRETVGCRCHGSP